MTKNGIIEKYLNEEIPTFLKKYEIPEAAIEIVKKDIGKRIYSLLYHWNDIEFRNAFLSIGLEEATYYQPSKNLDLKSFVVVAIRNSQFENLVSTSEGMFSIGCDYNEKTKQLEQEVEKFTSKAISYFRRVDFEKISKEITLSKEEDYFGEIAAAYPSAFLALSKIGNTKQLEVHYEKVGNQKYKIPELRKNVSIANLKGAVVLSGVSEMFDDRLILMLQQMKNEGYAYFDSFKMLTRNTEKLFKVLEFALTHNCVFLTSNFYISNNYVSRRKTLLKPAHHNADYYKNLVNVSGLQQEQKKLKQRHIQRSAV